MDLKAHIGLGYPPVDENERLFRLLYAVLSSEGELKQAAEQALEKVEVADAYPVQLAKVLLNPKWRNDVRILASTKLEKFVKTHWCVTDEKFLPPEIIPGNKTRIKKLLLAGLSETTTKVQGAVVRIISTIVPWDWPNNWPGLIDTLVSCFNGEKKLGVKAALSILYEFDLTDVDNRHIDSVAILLREMNRIFAGENQYSQEIRCLTCQTFSKVVCKIAQKEQLVMIQRYLQPAVVSFGTTSTQLWTSRNCGSKLKICILDALIAWMECIPKYILDLLADLLPLVWQTLIQCAKDYRAHVVNRPDGPKKGKKSIATKMDNCSTELVEALLKFLEQLMNPEDRYSLNIPDCELLHDEWLYLQDCFSTPHAVRHVIMMMEVTEKQMNLWNTDFDDFIEQEDMLNFTRNGIRRRALELIIDIGIQNRGIASSLIMVIMRYLEQENGKRINGRSGVSQSDWKSHEAFLMAFCLMKHSIVWKKNGNSSQYNVGPFLENIVLADLTNHASHPFLVSRCLIIGGTYSAHMPKKLGTAFLEATVNCLQEKRPTIVKISAVDAISLWYHQNEFEKKNNPSMLLPHVPALFEGLLTFAESLKSSGAYNLCMTGAVCLMSFDKTLTASLASRIYSLTETGLLKHDLVKWTTEWLTIIKELTLNHDCLKFLRKRVTADLPKMMIIGPLENCQTGAAALQIMTVLLKHSPLPLRYFMIDTLFFTACNYIVGTANWQDIQSHGIELIETYTSVAAEEALYYQDEDGSYGAQYILQVVLHALRTHKTDEIETRKVCQILILLINKTWYEIRENIDEMLKTLLHCIRSKEFAHDTQKLFMVYAHLISRRSDTIFKFFSDALSPSEQKSSMELIISEGLCKQYSSVDGEERKTVKLALGKVLEHALTNPSSPLHQITLKESLGGPIPLLVKISRLVVDN